MAGAEDTLVSFGRRLDLISQMPRVRARQNLSRLLSGAVPYVALFDAALAAEGMNLKFLHRLTNWAFLPPAPWCGPSSQEKT